MQWQDSNHGHPISPQFRHHSGHSIRPNNFDILPVELGLLDYIFSNLILIEMLL